MITKAKLKEAEHQKEVAILNAKLTAKEMIISKQDELISVLKHALSIKEGKEVAEEKVYKFIEV